MEDYDWEQADSPRLRISPYQALKREGHDLLRDIEALGLPQNEAYGRMAGHLGMSRRLAHFSAMRTLPLLTAAVEYLRELRCQLQLTQTHEAIPRTD